MKRSFVCIMMIMILLSSIHSTLIYVAAETEPGENPNPSGEYKRDEPNLVIGRNYKMPVFKAGTEARLAIPIENTTNGEALNVFVSPVIEDPKDFPFEINNMVTSRKISSISGRNTENAVFYLNVKKNAEGKMYPLKLNIEYTSSNGGSSSLSQTIYFRIDNEYTIPSIKLTGTNIDGGKLTSGSTKTVGLTIKNNGALTAKDVKARLGGFSNNELLLDSPMDTINVQTLAGGEERTVYFNVVSNPDLDNGTYSLDLVLTYKDEYDSGYETETKVYLPLEGKGSKQTTFSFDNLTYPQGELEPYTDFKIAFDLKNTGGEDANSVKVSIDAGEEILPKSMSVKSLGKLTAGKSVPVEFVMFAKDKIESKNYPIKISVEYETGSGSKRELQTFNQYVGVYINSNDRDMGAPKVIVDWYDYGAEFVKAGEAFPLSISFYNTNRTSDVRNIRVSLTSDGDVFSPVGSSNSFFIEEIPAGGRIERVVTLRPKIDATYKTHNVFADIEYEDTKGKAYSTKELIGVPIVQETNLVMGDIALSNENFVGTPIALSLEFYNAGRGLMRNMIISIEGNFDTNEGSLYIGNLEAGKNNYYDATIIPTAPGTLNGRIVFEYDDEIDQHFILEKEFSLEIMEQMQHFMPEPFMEPENMNNTSGKIKIVGGIVIVILAAVGGVIYYKRRKKKLEEVDMYE